jgi:hypothetical protein
MTWQETSEKTLAISPLPSESSHHPPLPDQANQNPSQKTNGLTQKSLVAIKQDCNQVNLT